MTVPTTSTCAGQNAWPLRYSFDPLPPAHNGPAVATSTPVRITTSNLRIILAPPGSEMGTQDLQYRPVHRLPVSSRQLVPEAAHPGTGGSAPGVPGTAATRAASGPRSWRRPPPAELPAAPVGCPTRNRRGTGLAADART